jgi:hypothetical protein
MADTKPKSIPKDGRDAKSPQKAGKPKSEVKRPGTFSLILRQTAFH